MSDLKQHLADTEEERTVSSESYVESWLDDEFFDELADIINENFVIEVEASRRFRS